MSVPTFRRRSSSARAAASWPARRPRWWRTALQQAWPELEVRVEIIKTRGDEQSAERSEPLDPRAGRKGLFTGEIERALAAGEIDLPCIARKICRATRRRDWKCAACCLAPRWKTS